MSISRRVAASAALALAAASVAGAQAPADLARQHLESGIQFYQQQRYNQALNDFQIIVTSMPNTEFADDALLQIGRYYLEVEENFSRAKESLDTILRSYPTSDSAPGAYYYLGEVTFRSDRTGKMLDDALANYQRVFLYPANPWIPAALYSTGLALERQGKVQEAVDAYFQVIVDHPRSEWTGGARLGVGRSYVRQGDPLEAMAQFQQARNTHPDGPEAEAALDWLTLLFRLYGTRMLGQSVSFKRDSGFNPAVKDKLNEVIAVRSSASGVHVLDRDTKRILTFDGTGKLASSQPAVEPYGLSVDARGELVVANERAVVVEGKPSTFTVPSEKGPKPLEKIRGAVRDRLGDLYIYDEGEKKVLRFRPTGDLVGPFPDATPRELLKIEMDPIGNVLLLDKRNRDVTVLNPEGRAVARIQTEKGEWGMKKAVDIALDPAGYLYVLDEQEAKIAVFDASYQFVTLLTQQNLGGALAKPTSLDVDSSGDLYVYDEKEKAVVRLH
ncbi:MAG TPA: tetratricopeptide repeat protein [Vicinamibacteria bacterium]